MKKFILVLFMVGILLVSVVFTALAQEKVETIHLTIGTASVGGAWYPIGIQIAKIWNSNIPGAKSVAQATAGSPQNIELLRNKEVNVALIRDTECERAIKGIEKYEGHAAPWLRCLFPLPTTGSEIFALKDSGINSIFDMKGKRVAVGPIGSGGEADARDFLGLYGMTLEDIKPEYIEASQAVEMMKDGLIDGAFLGLTGGSSAAIELMTTGKVKLVPLDEDILNEHIAKNPQYTKRIIEANFYPNQNYTVLARGSTPDLLVVREDMSEELAYILTKTIAENYQLFQQAHSMVAIWKPEMAKDKPYTPYHPGALKYWKEKGILQ